MSEQFDPTKENKIQYAIRVVRLASFGKLKEVVKESSKQSGQSEAKCLREILHCMRKFGAGYYDYLIFQFWDKTDAQRDTFLTRFRSKKLINQANKAELSHIFDNKDEFDAHFHKYLKRDFVDMTKEPVSALLEFLEGRDRVFCKLRNLGGGEGAERLVKADFASVKDMAEYILEKKFATVEDVIENHPDFAKVYDGAVNTMRMTTLVGDDGKPYLLYAVLKFGRDGRVVDNYGVQGPINLETGIYDFPGHPGDTTDHRWFTHHPNSGEPLVGLKVPFFEEAKQMVCEAALVIPELRYIGWDVAITPEGPAIIEGNNFTAHDFVQLPGQTPDKIGLMPMIKSIVPSFKF